MLVSVIPIGNSRGIRIPKNIITELNIEDKLDLTLLEKTIVLKTVKKKPRQNWDEVFAQMHQNGDDSLLVPDTLEDEFFDKNWDW